MTAWLDRVTGRVTMYRLVTLLLGVTGIAALVLSLVGGLFYTPLELIASAAVALASTVVANRVFALVFRTMPHLESSIITGLLLFFLFLPSLEPAALGTLAIAGVLATASKYLIAVRGRHILNPAAAGASLVAVLQLPSAGWWVATSSLLPVTLIGAFLVLYRTRRLSMGLVFVAVSASILVARLTASGQSVAESVSTTFASYPIIFFVGFMLSEPLTMAPRRWQQLTIAALVGALFTVPFMIGPVFLSFETSLVIGNALAFLAGQRRGIRLSYLGKTQLTPTSWEFQFQPERPVSFRAGQYMELTVPHPRADARGSRRFFSIASAPTTDGPVAFALRMAQPGSSFKRALLDLGAGAHVRGTAVGGDFLLPRDASKPVLLIAGGIGITPFLSQLGCDRAAGVERDTVLVYTVSTLEELAFREELREERVLLVSPAQPDDLPSSWRWIGAGPLSSELLTAEVPALTARAAFVSGSPTSIVRARTALRGAGVRRVRTDYFTGY